MIQPYISGHSESEAKEALSLILWYHLDVIIAVHIVDSYRHETSPLSEDRGVNVLDWIARKTNEESLEILELAMPGFKRGLSRRVNELDLLTLLGEKVPPFAVELWMRNVFDGGPEEITKLMLGQPIRLIRDLSLGMLTVFLSNLSLRIKNGHTECIKLLGHMLGEMNLILSLRPESPVLNFTPIEDVPEKQAQFKFFIEGLREMIRDESHPARDLLRGVILQENCGLSEVNQVLDPGKSEGDIEIALELYKITLELQLRSSGDEETRLINVVASYLPRIESLLRFELNEIPLLDIVKILEQILSIEPSRFAGPNTFIIRSLMKSAMRNLKRVFLRAYHQPGGQNSLFLELCQLLPHRVLEWASLESQNARQ